MNDQDQVTFRCRYCGGEAIRGKDTYFAVCPYCGMQVGFDELKEEAQVEYYRQRVQNLEQSTQGYFANREKLRHWIRRRNLFLTIFTIVHFLSWLLMAYGAQIESDDTMAMGAIGIVFTIIVALTFLPLMAISYPEYNILTGQIDKGMKHKVLLKSFGLTALFFGAVMMLAFIIIAIIYS